MIVASVELERLLAFYEQSKRKEYIYLLDKHFPQQPPEEEFTHCEFCSSVITTYLAHLLKIELSENSDADRYHGALGLHKYQQIEEKFFKVWN